MAEEKAPYGHIGRSSAKVQREPNLGGQEKTYLVLRRSDDDGFPFRIGFSRARLILKHLEAIKQFLQEYGETKKEETHGKHEN